MTDSRNGLRWQLSHLMWGQAVELFDDPPDGLEAARFLVEHEIAVVIAERPGYFAIERRRGVSNRDVASIKQRLFPIWCDRKGTNYVP